VYLVVKRGLKVPFLDSFDFANSTSPAGTRPVTTTAPQGLMLLNDRFVQSQCDALVLRVVQDAGAEKHSQIARAFHLVLQRDPTSSELQAADKCLAEERRLSVEKKDEDPDREALKSLCRGLLNINEMVYVD
jgi:hypothetical protein